MLVRDRTLPYNLGYPAINSKEIRQLRTNLASTDRSSLDGPGPMSNVRPRSYRERTFNHRGYT
jgi:hypothetical protein